MNGAVCYLYSFSHHHPIFLLLWKKFSLTAHKSGQLLSKIPSRNAKELNWLHKFYLDSSNSDLRLFAALIPSALGATGCSTSYRGSLRHPTFTISSTEHLQKLKFPVQFPLTMQLHQRKEPRHGNFGHCISMPAEWQRQAHPDAGEAFRCSHDQRPKNGQKLFWFEKQHPHPAGLAVCLALPSSSLPTLHCRS